MKQLLQCSVLGPYPRLLLSIADVKVVWFSYWGKQPLTFKVNLRWIISQLVEHNFQTYFATWFSGKARGKSTESICIECWYGSWPGRGSNWYLNWAPGPVSPADSSKSHNTVKLELICRVHTKNVREFLQFCFIICHYSGANDAKPLRELCTLKCGTKVVWKLSEENDEWSEFLETLMVWIWHYTLIGI